MPRDRKSMIGRHRADANAGWQRANPTGAPGAGLRGTHRPAAPAPSWQRANPTGGRGPGLLGSHRTAPAPAPIADQHDAAPPVYSDYNDDDIAPPVYTDYNDDDAAPPVYSDYSADDAAPPVYSEYNGDDVAPPVYSEYNGDDPAPPVYSEYNGDDPAPPVYSEFEAPPTVDGNVYDVYSGDAPGTRSYTTQLDAVGGAPAPTAYREFEEPPTVDGNVYDVYSGDAPGTRSYTTQLDAVGGAPGLGGQDAPAAARPVSHLGGGQGLRRKQLFDHYAGEESSVAWRMPAFEAWAARRNLDPDDPATRQQHQAIKDSTRATTDYDTTPEKREQSRLKESADGSVSATHQRRDGRNHSRDRAEDVGWVMDPANANIHTFDMTRQIFLDNGDTVNTHHSTPLAGGDVAGAGTMSLVDGHVHKLTDQSGHYRPEAEYTHQSVEQMAARGILDRRADRKEQRKHKSGPGNMSARVELSGFVEDDPRQGKRWLQGKEYYQGPLSLPYQAFLQTQGNEVQARRKVSLQEELLATTAKAPAHRRAGRQDRGGDRDIRRDVPAAAHVYDAPGSAHVYDAPDSAHVYDAPDSAHVYDAPGSAHVYDAPDSAHAYDAPGSAHAYDAPGVGPLAPEPAPAPATHYGEYQKYEDEPAEDGSSQLYTLDESDQRRVWQ